MKKYILLKNIITKDGNMLFARTAPYMEGEIPKEFINPLNVETIEDTTQVMVYKETSASVETHYLNPQTEVVNLTPKFYDAKDLTVVQKLDLNTIQLDQLKEIKGIGEKTAVQLITNRPYTDLIDLTAKVKPPTGKSWSEFNFMFSDVSPVA